MPKGISVVALLVISIGAITSVAGAQANAGAANPTTTRIKTSKEVTPEWTAKGTMYGFVTCDKFGKRSSKVSLDSLDDIKKCVANGGRYAFGGGNQVLNDAAEQAKLAPFAGQFVAVEVTMTSKLYGTGPRADTPVEGLYSGGRGPAKPAQMYQVLSVEADPTPDPREREAGFSDAVPEQRAPEN